MLDAREKNPSVQKIFEQVIPEKSALSDLLIRNVANQLESDMQHNLSIEEIAVALNMNKDYLGKQIKKKTGLPFRILNNRVKVEYAKILIKSGRYKMYEVSEMLGYSSPDYFARIFKSEVKIAPAEYKNRCLENYPTHELGPISKCLNINKGNRMLSLVSVASKARGIETYMKDHVPADHPFAGKKFKQGDVINTIITCAGGETIHLTLDTTLPRAFYSREFTIRGTKGMCEESGAEKYTFFLEGMEEGKYFDNKAEMYEKYDHPLHKEFSSLGEKGGHGGMDWLVTRAFVESVKTETEPPIDVYDTAVWLAIGPLSEASINKGSQPVEIPDFTRGKWFRRENELHQGKYSLDIVVNDPDTPIF